MIIGILAASMLLPAYYIGVSFGKGFTHGYERAENSDNLTDMEISPANVTFDYDWSKISAPTDTLVTEEGQRLPLIVTQAVVMVPDSHRDIAMETLMIISYLISFILFICFITVFIVFIININKGRIFIHKNVSRLRRMAWYLIGVAVFRCAGGLADDSLLSGTSLTVDGYELSATWTFPWTALIIGLLAMLMAEIWGNGIKMKEEQELTI